MTKTCSGVTTAARYLWSKLNSPRHSGYSVLDHIHVTGSSRRLVFNSQRKDHVSDTSTLKWNQWVVTFRRWFYSPLFYMLLQVVTNALVIGGGGGGRRLGFLWGLNSISMLPLKRKEIGNDHSHRQWTSLTRRSDMNVLENEHGLFPNYLL